MVCLSVSSTFDVCLTAFLCGWLSFLLSLSTLFYPPPPPPFLCLCLFSLSFCLCLSLVLKFCHGIISVDRHSLHMPPIYECDCIYTSCLQVFHQCKMGCLCVCMCVCVWFNNDVPHCLTWQAFSKCGVICFLLLLT